MTSLATDERVTTTALPLLVTDSVRAAWDDSDHRAYASLDTGWVRENSDYLAPFAYDLIRPFLAAGWREHSLVLRVEEDGGFEPDRGNEVEPAREIYHAVWQKAADQITTEALLTRAGIDPNSYLRS
jgi:hypothetical protein